MTAIILLLSKYWQVIAGVFGFVSLLIGKKFYDKGKRAEGEQNISRELFNSAAEQVRDAIRKEAENYPKVEKVLKRVPDSWSNGGSHGVQGKANNHGAATPKVSKSSGMRNKTK